MDRQIENYRDEIIKSLRKELVSSEIRFQNIINQNSIPILIVSIDGIIRFANSAAEYLFNKSKEKLMGIPFGYPLLHVDSTEINIITKNYQTLTVDMRVLETVWEDEKVFLISLRDVTYRRNIEEQLRVSEEKYKSLVDLSPFGIFVHIDGICIFANAAGIELLGGKSSEDIIGQSVMRFVHPDFRSFVSDRIKNLVSGEIKLPAVEEKFISLDGSILDVEVFGTKFNYNNKPAIQLVVIDITERKKNEDFIRNINFELENQIKEKTRQLEIMYQNMENFSYSLSYDTNSPLQNIESSINFLLQNIQHKLEPNELSHLEKIKNSANNISNLMKALHVNSDPIDKNSVKILD